MGQLLGLVRESGSQGEWSFAPGAGWLRSFAFFVRYPALKFFIFAKVL